MTSTPGEVELFHAKAAEHWRAARAEFDAGRFDAAVALAYYSCFQIGIAAHIAAGLPADRGQGYSHGLIWRTINSICEAIGELDLIGVIDQVYGTRIRAQYRPERTPRGSAAITMTNTQALTSCIRARLEAAFGRVSNEAWQ